MKTNQIVKLAKWAKENGYGEIQVPNNVMLMFSEYADTLDNEKKFDPKKLMTPEEVVEYFSATDEFKVLDEGKNFRVSYTADGRMTDSLIWKKHINIQQLIRKVQQLVWNHCNNI
jgi:hypothetical protein